MTAGAAWRQRADELFASHRDGVFARTDRMFARLLILQWLAGIAAALWVSPRTWLGSTSSVHLHVELAVLLGGAIAAAPVCLAVRRPGGARTRHVIAACQGLTSALLIHLTGGRIETHFHVFGSLAFLSFYRDWKVLITASLVVGADHLVRGVVAPESVYGVLAISPWRWLEHVGWVLFEDVFLIYACRTSVHEMREIAAQRAQLEATKASIELQVRERTVELAEARDDALAAARAKSEFLASISHELRTPLNGIIGMTGFLLDGELEAAQREHAETVRSCSESLLALVNDLLDVSKMEAGRIELECIEFDVRPLVDEVADLLAARAQAKGLQLRREITGAAPTRVHGDPYRLRQVLLNLADNAVKFTAAGHVTIHVDAVAQADGSPGLRFEVTDTGIGIPEDRLSRLFVPFSQADASTTRTFGGTGLGLVICKRLAEAMGGGIGVESRAGAGSRFWFTIPLRAATAENAPATGAASVTAPDARDPRGARDARDARDARGTRDARDARGAPTAAPLQGVRVLVVEDNAINQRVATTMLHRLGCHVDAVGNGREALQVLAGAAYDLVLMDCMMPEMDGYDATRAIRRREAEHGGHRLPIVAVTANALPADRGRCVEAGMDEHLAKPLRLAELAEAMGRLLAHSGRISQN